MVFSGSRAVSVWLGFRNLLLVALGCMLDSALRAGSLGSFCLVHNPVIA